MSIEINYIKIEEQLVKAIGKELGIFNVGGIMLRAEVICEYDTLRPKVLLKTDRGDRVATIQLDLLLEKNKDEQRARKELN